MKKLFPLLFLASLSLISCSELNNDNRIKLASNIETYLFEKENSYQEPDIDKISANIELNANFAIYFTSEGCSSCINFSPIIDEYVKANNLLIYKYNQETNYEQFLKFKEKYGERFFDEPTLSLPALFILEDGNVNKVNYDSYMKTKSAFFNYMNRNYISSHIFYTTGNVFEQEFYFTEFAYIYFDQNSSSLMDIYKQKLMEPSKKSHRDVIISNYAEDDQIHLKLTGRNEKKESYSRLEFIVNDKTSDETILKVL